MINHPLFLYNSLTKQKEKFTPINSPFVGIYLCGPTVYGDPHLGHARPAICFDILFRFLKYLGYRVRYVRNITDVGHLVGDADSGEDKIGQKAKLEQLEPMEVAQYYIDRYHKFIDSLNVLRPSIEPRATGHIPEQIKLIKSILDNGFAYEVNGSVYLDVPKYAAHYAYGLLSGRELDDLMSGTRELAGGSEKRHLSDFALWKRAEPEHLMRWESPWSIGFPGWHIECTAMSTKYLGNQFDIHAGGIDLLFPHHEAEIAQANACSHPHPPSNEAKFWLHCNMITISGKKMGKSLGNFITLDEFYTGKHTLLSQSYSPQTIRFFILQAHYRSTLDFSNEALIASEKALKRIQTAWKLLPNLPTAPNSTLNIKQLQENLLSALYDDLNTAIAIAHIFEAVSWIHAIQQGVETISPQDLQEFQETMNIFLSEVLGIQPDFQQNTNTQSLSAAMNLLIEIRQQARSQKDFKTSDNIRDKLKEAGILLKDGNNTTTWELL